MRKILLILTLVAISIATIAQNKYAVYPDSMSAVTKIASLNKEVLPICRARKDFTTKTYSVVKKHPTQNKWLVIILKEYEYLFTSTEIKNSITL